MSTQVLYRRYRPDKFEDLIGQEQVTVPLQRALSAKRITHAYLFSGPRGCGKTTSARILARCLNCIKGPAATPCGECESCKELATGSPGSIDVIEIDAASHNGVDDARALREQAEFSPNRDRYKIFILDEAHEITSHGFNALLKIVEEPPEHIIFIFATTEPEKVIGTIRSRTYHYPFKLVSISELGPYIEKICQEESAKLDKGVLQLILRSGGGSVRDTLSVLDQLLAASDNNFVSYEIAHKLLGYTPASIITDFIAALINKNGEEIFALTNQIVSSGFAPEHFVEDLLARWRDMLTLSVNPNTNNSILLDTPPDQLETVTKQSQNLGIAKISVLAEQTNLALENFKGATSPAIQIELLAAKLLTNFLTN
jgi:DNA polymerase-3 subunit gamma/tau